MSALHSVVIIMFSLLALGAADSAPVAAGIYQPAALFDPAGESRPSDEDFMAALKAINAKVSERMVATAANQDAIAAGEEMPGATQTWALWAFWASDVPEHYGLAGELLRVRASGLAVIRPVHLAGMRHFEAFTQRVEDYRKRVIASDPQVFANGNRPDWMVSYDEEWKATNQMIEIIHGGTISVVQDMRQAIALRVESVPSFRLVSPGGWVHSLDGFTPGADIVRWISMVQAWEQNERSKN